MFASYNLKYSLYFLSVLRLNNSISIFSLYKLNSVQNYSYRKKWEKMCDWSSLSKYILIFEVWSTIDQFLSIFKILCSYLKF